ncbi:DUF3011 domain-containing protein [Lysobacter sp. GCM10012299]|uniref:DUF3011 domain-containing protein n=1 Tax=Lysobacter sp. GCM10012299 TaxID=3317333 RepID=UPI0036191FB0
MATATKRTFRFLGLAWLLAPALATHSAALPSGATLSASASAEMRVGLTLVDANPAQSVSLPDPATLPYPASKHAVMCRSDGRSYRECRTPFHGPVELSREINGTRCVEHRNWGWREGAVWVGSGCDAVFVRSNPT